MIVLVKDFVIMFRLLSLVSCQSELNRLTVHIVLKLYFWKLAADLEAIEE